MSETPVVDCLREQNWSRVDLAREVVRLRAERDAYMAALLDIEAMSWDSGSIPAPEVVSRIYSIARAALPAPAKEGA